MNIQPLHDSLSNPGLSSVSKPSRARRLVNSLWLLALVVGFVTPLMAAPAPGSLDSTFNDGSGYSLLAFPGVSRGRALALQTDGKIVEAGLSSGTRFGVARLMPNGSLDQSFGTAGKTETVLGPYDNSEPRAVVVDVNGRVTVVGWTLVDDLFRHRVAAVRYLASGALDTSFGTGGRVIISLTGVDDSEGHAAALRPDGKIVIGGRTRANAGTGADFLLMQLTTSGALDTSFGGGDGWVVTDFSTREDEINALVRLTDGTLIAAGFASTAGTTNFAYARYSADGTLGAVASYDFVGREDRARALAVLPDGRAVLAGFAHTASLSGRDVAVLRLTSAANPDPSFDADGKFTTGFFVSGGVSSDEAAGVAVQSDGKIVLAGSTTCCGPAGPVVMRLNADGSPDAGFGSGGTVMPVVAGNLSSKGQAMALDGDGRIVVVGEVQDAGLNERATVHRFLPGEYPFRGVPATLPGRIEAEHFNNGGPGVAYYDTTPHTNEATLFKSEVRPGSGVDLGKDYLTAFSPDNAYLTEARAGEYLRYTVNAPVALPSFSIRVAVKPVLGKGGKFLIAIDGWYVTDSIQIPDIDTARGFQVISVPGLGGISAGDHTLTIVFEQNAPGRSSVGEIDYLVVSASPADLPGCVNPVMQSLQGWWRGEGAGGDSSGNDFHAASMSGVTYAPGAAGQGFSFAGNGSVNFGNSIGNFGDGEFTVDFWIKTTATGIDGVMGKRAGCSHGSFWSVLLVNGRIEAEFDGDANGTGHAFMTSRRLINDGLFHHVAIARQRRGYALYIDGEVDATVDAADWITIANTAPFEIGRMACSGINAGSFNGVLDEVGLSHRTLSLGEIRAIYQAAGAGRCGVVSVLDCKPVPPGLVGLWRGEDNTADGSAYRQHGTLAGGAAYGDGEIGQGFSFNGSSSYVQVGETPALKMRDEMTFEAWVFPTGPGAAADGGILVSRQGEYDIARHPDGTIRYAFANTSPGWVEVNSGVSFAVGNWTHLALTYQLGVVRLYVNGTLAHTYYGSGPIGDAGPAMHDFRIGGRQATAHHFEGRLDEVAIYNRALGGVEIHDLYSSGLFFIGKCPTPAEACPALPTTCVAWWKADGNALDASGAGHHGSLSAGTTFATGKIGQGILFDGSSDRVTVPDDDRLDFGITDSMTIEGWVRVDGTGGGSVLDKSGSSGSYGISAGPVSPQGLTTLTATLLGTVGGNFGYANAFTQPFSAGIFHHLAVVLNRQAQPTPTLSIYLDGVLQQSTPVPASFDGLAHAGDLILGGSSFRGALDDLAIYRRALSAGQVAAIHSAGSGGKCAALIPNTAPVVLNPLPHQSLRAGQPFNYTVPANTFSETDDGQFLTYSAANLPAGVTFDPATRTFSGTPAAGHYTITVTVRDNGTPSLSATTQFTLSVINANYIVINKNNSGPGSLRQAMLDANAASGGIIGFDIRPAGPHTIQPLTGLPDINRALTIDGSTQEGFAGQPIIEVSGRGLSGGSASVWGFRLFASGCVVRGLVINRFSYGISVEAGGCRIEGNFIGTDLSGTVAEPNNYGVDLIGVNGVLGGQSAAARNVISGNRFHGVRVGYLAQLISGNFIGTDVTGLRPLGNGFSGIQLYTSTTHTVIGDTADGRGAPNIIAFNSRYGVEVAVTAGLTNRIRGNSIHSNVGMGITYRNGVPTPNDTGDLALPQNYPVITGAANDPSGLVINGTLNSKPNSTYRLDLFASPACDATGYGEGKHFLGFINVTTDASGNVTFQATFPAVIGEPFITATALDLNGNTSEFSACRLAVDRNVPLTPTADRDNNGFTVFSWCWTDPANVYQLEWTPSLTPPVTWQRVTVGITQTGDQKCLMEGISNGSPSGFYRLRWP